MRKVRKQKAARSLLGMKNRIRRSERGKNGEREIRM
jgi:hypothetical protein